MMDSFASALAFTSVWSLGFFLVMPLRYRGTWYETASVAWFAGLFVHSWGIFLLGLAGVPFSRGWLLPADIMLTVIGIISGLRSIRLLRGTVTPRKDNASVKLVLTLFAAYMIMHAAINSERVVSFSDAVMSYDFRARAITYEGTIRPVIYDWPEVITPNFGYPPLTTLFHAHYYLLGGTNPKLLYSVLLFSLSGVVGGAVLRATKNPFDAALAACFIAFLPVVRKFSLLAVLDFTALAYYGLGAVALLNYDGERKWQHLLMAAVGFSGVAFLRPEDPIFMVWLAPVIVTYFGVRGRGWFVLGAIAVLYAAVFFSHEYFLRYMAGLAPRGQLNFSWTAVFSGERFLKAAWALLRHFSSDRFMLLGPVCVLLCVFCKPRGRERLLLGMLVAFCLAWLTLVMIDNAGDWEVMRINWSYFRVFIRISPLFILFVFTHHAVNKAFTEISCAISSLQKRKRTAPHLP